MAEEDNTSEMWKLFTNFNQKTMTKTFRTFNDILSKGLLNHSLQNETAEIANIINRQLIKKFRQEHIPLIAKMVILKTGTYGFVTPNIVQLEDDIPGRHNL